MKALYDAKQLEGGQWYRITDYETILSSSLGDARSAGHRFDILVMALDNENLSEDAKATWHEYPDDYIPSDTSASDYQEKYNEVHYFDYSDLNAWELKYRFNPEPNDFGWITANNAIKVGDVFYQRYKKGDVEGAAYPYCWKSNFGNVVNYRYSTTEEPAVNDILKGNSAGTGSDYTCTDAYTGLTGNKGVIYWMLDESNNECEYDFKNVQFRRRVFDKQSDILNILTPSDSIMFNAGLHLSICHIIFQSFPWYAMYGGVVSTSAVTGLFSHMTYEYTDIPAGTPYIKFGDMYIIYTDTYEWFYTFQNMYITRNDLSTSSYSKIRNCKIIGNNYRLPYNVVFSVDNYFPSGNKINLTIKSSMYNTVALGNSSNISEISISNSNYCTIGGIWNAKIEECNTVIVCTNDVNYNSVADIRQSEYIFSFINDLETIYNSSWCFNNNIFSIDRNKHIKISNSHYINFEYFSSNNVSLDGVEYISIPTFVGASGVLKNVSFRKGIKGTANNPKIIDVSGILDKDYETSFVADGSNEITVQ